MPDGGRTGELGLGGGLGYEGRKVVVNGTECVWRCALAGGGRCRRRLRYAHAVSTHAVPHGRPPAFAAFRLPPGGPWAASVTVGINDGNNRQGLAGSSLTFRLKADGVVLWQSSGVRRAGVPQGAAEVRVPGDSTELRLEVEAASSANCAHAVWLDPVLRRV